ncbi:MAG: hypothetical protein JWQ84_2762 [Mucilaginibacter sp.]|nr:hypothetical protein [Mucilaginibacter sp.]
MKTLSKSCSLFSILITTFLFTTSFWASGVKTTDIQIKRGSSKSVKIGCSQSALIAAFGKPTHIKNYYFEIDEKKGHIVNYNGSDFYFEDDDKLMNFEIKTAGFNLTFGHPHMTVSIGTNEKSIPPGFKVYGGNNRANVYEFYNAEGSLTDQYLEFDYTGSSITRIMYGDN